MLEKKTRVIERNSVYVYYIIGLTWMIAAFMIPMIKLSSYILLAVLSIGEYFILTKVLPKEKIVEEYLEAPNTGNLELDEVLTLGNNYLEAIRKANEAIKDEALSKDIESIEATALKIFKAVENRPKELGKIRKFISYYLPTTIKLLNAYAEFEGQDLKVENIEKSMTSIKNSVSMITSSFEKLLNSIYEDDMLDITTDIAVYEKMVSVDGYKGLSE
ncbi:MAG: 5-bromo-4-chloroindolyl phosphate hydrolysis family protein [Erysipelotrichales bacterium]|nr:5-bromo-4-chloroindolyl phosphate hydrolysis family protein [Erysipelotrichales bacterium]